jgi:predicted RND superfamily exporter protein
MTLLAYGSVVVLCGLALRSWRGVVVTVLPLVVTSALCAGLMAGLGMGVTLATLPAIALGAGIPDHALYLLSVQLALQRDGVPLAEAHRRSLRTTGGAVVLVGVTLTCGVAAWATSPIRMQADLGLLLGFMFLGSVAGALVLIPALSAFLLADEGRARR